MASSSSWRHLSHRANALAACTLVLILLFLGQTLFPSSLQNHKGLRPHPLKSHLIIIPGHAIFTGQDPHKASDWAIDTWQVPLLEHLIRHIELGIAALKGDDKAVVVFSGGATRKNAGHVSEAYSYHHVARIMGYITDYDDPNRFVLEEFARDSYENLLFSICAFRVKTGNYPLKVTVVGFDFKRKRFISHHATAILYRNIDYLGVGPELNAKHGTMEDSGTIPQFAKDPYGCSPPLSTKRASRNPFEDSHEYAEKCPELADLLKWCGPKLYSKGNLPWN